MSVRPDAEKSRQSIITQFFLEDLGSIPPELEKKLFEESDAAVLKNWLKIAATSKSIEELCSVFIKIFQILSSLFC